jgi:DNA-binding CsgD family transcriptional regulator
MLREGARLLGLIAEDGTEPEWAASVRRGEDAEPDALVRLLPAEVDRIFLQNDLTAIAPGPLEPALDVRLRGIAARESAAQASSYRFTAESMAHAFVVGETEESILEFLGAISLTGGVRGIGLLLPRSDIAGLAELAESQGTSEIRRLLPDPETLTLDAAPTVHLKPRERQVLGLAASGLTNAQIAAQLFLSPNTVKYHLARAYRTLGVATRDEAVAAAGLHRQLSDPTRDV